MGILQSSEDYGTPPDTLTLSGGRQVSVGRVLAQGGFSTVFECVESGSGTVLALKRILAQSKEQEVDALKEIDVHKSLGGSSPPSHIIPLLASQIYLSKTVPTMKEIVLLFPLYKQSLLDLVLSDTCLDQVQCLTILLKVCRGASAMHKAGLSHRDIKPANVMLDEMMEPVLMDLGSCDAVTIQVSSRQYALEIQERAEQQSSAPFRAPELWDVASDCVLDGVKTDVWSLGCTLYAITFGKGYSPFESPERGLEPLGIRNGNVKFDSSSPFAESLCQQLIEEMVLVSPSKRLSLGQVCDHIETFLQTVDL